MNASHAYHKLQIIQQVIHIIALLISSFGISLFLLSILVPVQGGLW